jgi:FkbM family methyltransferase
MSAGKRVIQSLIGRLGYEVRRIPAQDSVAIPSPITVALTTLLSVHDELRIVQIGANDGRINDPIFPFLTNHTKRTRALLIEPQATVLPYLRSNYAEHPGAIIANNAIGPAGELTLYSISPEAWEHCVVPYADPTWPPYRAPTGITSTNRDMVVDWAHKHYRGKLPASSVVVAFSVDSLTLTQVIQATGYPTPIHLLQVDVEGFDDEAIYNSGVDVYRPELVNFESKSLPQQRHARLVRYLEDLGYMLFPTGTDTLGVRQEGTSRRPSAPHTERSGTGNCAT